MASMASIEPIFLMVPFVGFVFLLALWLLLFIAGTRTSRCRRCSKPFHDMDDVVLIVTPFGFKAQHGYRCKQKGAS